MKSTYTQIREKTKNLFLISDYLLWLLLDLSKFKRIKKEKIKKVLIIHLGAIGELLVTTPLFPALKKTLKCDISFMVSKGREEIFKNNPHLSEIITYEDNFKKNIKILKNKDFDLAIILFPGSIQLSLMCLLAGIKYRIGCFSGLKKGPALFFTRRVFPIFQKNKRHALEKNLSMIKQIGIENKNPKIEVYVTKKEKQSVKNKLKKLKVKDYIIVHPGFGFSTKHKYPSRLWPLDRYAKVIDHIVKNYPVKVLLTGSADEKIFAEKIKEKVKDKRKVIITNGLFDLMEISYLISKARLLIGPSTSVIHIATAFDTPLILLGGEELQDVWYPQMTKEKYKVLFHPEVCTECDKDYCRKKTIECMNAITTEEVIESSISLLNN